MIKVNLLNPEKKSSGDGDALAVTDEQQTNDINIPLAVGTFAVIVVLIGFLYISQQVTISNLRDNINIAKAEKAKLDDVLKQLAKLKKAKATLANKVKVIENLRINQKKTVLMMDEVSKSLPDWVWITNLNYKNGSISLSGKALSNNLVSDYVTNLRETNNFLNIQLTSTSRKKEAGIDVFTFKLKCTYQNKSIKGKAV